MTYSFSLKSMMAALALIILSAGAARAETAIVSADLNLRGGPGIHYPIIATMRGGSPAEVGECYSGWCKVLWNGYEGYASQAYLDFGGYGAGYARGYVAPPPTVVVRPYYDYRPRVYHRGHHKKRYVKRKHYNKKHYSKKHYKKRRNVKRKHYNRGHAKRKHVRSNRRKNVDHLGNRVQVRPDGSSRVIVRNVDQGK